METSGSRGGAWVEVLNGPVRLRCWWAEPQDQVNDIDPKSCINRVYIVLPEVFGLNAWVRSVADRLAAQGYPALAVPLFAPTAPDLELAYDASDLAEGRRHKDATASEQIVADVAAAVSWFRARYPQAAIHVVGFCSGGMPLFLRPRCPGLSTPLISTAPV